jgi:polyribonucleotide nucleotidyltransferase
VKVEVLTVDKGTPETPNDSPDSLGTCAASIACSEMGIMIKGTVVAIKASYNNGDLNINGIWTAFAMAIRDIVDNGRQGRSVINISFGKSIVQYVK